MEKLSKLLLNSGVDAMAVTAPAFSLTKVMALVVPVLTGVVTLVSAQLKSVTFTSGQITVMVVALIAFLAITSSADVLARSRATAALDQRAVAWFDRPITARRVLTGEEAVVSVLGASGVEHPRYLCISQDQDLVWVPSAEVRFS